MILPLFLLYLPFMSVVRILTSYFCATEQITRADLLIYGQPVVLVALSLILPRTGLGPVSYTHLDVYKRQALRFVRDLGQGEYASYWHVIQYQVQ